MGSGWKRLTKVALLAAACAVTSSALHAQTGAITRKEVLNVPLEGLKNLDGVMYITDIPPGAAAPRHSHSGDEFNYILKGAVIVQPDGKAPFKVSAGEATFNPSGHIHTVKNASATEPAQVLAVLVHQKGKPLALAAPAP